MSHLPWDFNVLPWYRGIYLKTVRLTVKPWDLAGLEKCLWPKYQSLPDAEPACQFQALYQNLQMALA